MYRTFHLCFLLAGLITYAPLCFSQTESAIPNSYKEGLNNYQQSDYSSALEAFKNTLRDEPHNPYLHYNLALTEMKLGHIGYALGYTRSALLEDPSLDAARKLERHLSSQLKVKALPRQLSLYENLRESWLQPLSLKVGLIISAILLLVFGWVLISHIKKKKTHENNSPFPTLFLGLALLLALVMSALKLYDANIPRATVVSEKVSALSSPETESSSLFDLFEGLEVIVRQSHIGTNDKVWYQVTYPGGMTGWVPSEELLLHSEI